MEFSLFNLMTLPREGVTRAEVFGQMKAMVAQADDAGFDIAWFAEHHLSNYCLSSSPLTVTAHMAPLTKRIRLGPAVVVLPFYEPLRLIEDIFLVDQLLEGRFVLGLGTGYQPREFEKFGFPIEDRLARGLEVWDALWAAMESGVVDFQGKHVQIHDAALSLAPWRNPMPTFAVGNAPEVRRRIVARGATPLCTPGVQDPSVIGVMRGLLSETCAELGADDAALPFAVQRYVFVTEDKAEARLAAEEVLRQSRLATNMRQAEPAIDGFMLETPAFPDEPSIERILETSMIGSAETVAERIVEEARRYRITHLSVFMQFAYMPYRPVLRSLERFAAQVMPLVAREAGAAAA